MFELRAVWVSVGMALLWLIGCAGPELQPPEASLSRAEADSAGQGEPSASWLAEAQRQIAAREYRVSDNGQGLQAPNRAHNLRTYFEPTGIRVHDRTAAGSPELLRLAWVGIGRSEPLAPVAPGHLSSEEARVEIRRPGAVEWYTNAPAGLEQGFTLLERPEGEGALVLELSVERAQVSLQDERVILRTPSGRRLAYGQLSAVDAGAGRSQRSSPFPSPAACGSRWPMPEPSIP